MATAWAECAREILDKRMNRVRMAPPVRKETQNTRDIDGRRKMRMGLSMMPFLPQRLEGRYLGDVP